MFHTVLVPLDGSRFAESALPLAARLAKDAGAKLHLVQAHQPASALIGVGEAMLPSRELEFELRAREQSYLAAMAADLSASCRGTVEFEQVDGAGGPGICEEAGRVDAGLVVMAVHGRSTLRRLWLGSVADYVVGHLAVPIILVRPDRITESRTAPSLRDVLVALDLSKDAEAVLKPAIVLAKLTGAAVTLAHVSVPGLSPVLPEADSPAASRLTAKARLERIAAPLRRFGLRVATRVIGGGGAAGQLLDLLEGDEFDLIALTTHGHGGMRRLLLVNVADRVIRRTTKPVLVVRPPPAVT